MADFPTDAADDPAAPAGQTPAVGGSATTIIVDRDGIIQYASGAAERIFGHDIDDPEQLTEYIHDEDRAAVAEAIRAVGTAGDRPRFEFGLQDPQSDSRFEGVFHDPPADVLDGLVFTVRETGETPQGDPPDATKERMELALEGANLGIWDWDMASDEIDRDELLAEMLGYTPAEMGDTLEDWERLVHPEGEKRHNEALAEHVEANTPYYECEYRMQTDSGAWKWVRTIGKVVERDGDGTPLRAVGIHQDIDDRKRAELSLREERELFRQGPAIVFQWRDEPGWPIEYVSENVEEILGYDPDTLESEARAFADLVHEADLPELEHEITAQSAAGNTQFNPDPYRVVTADGEIRWVMEFTTTVQGTGETPQLLGYLVDITDRRLREEKYRNLFESARDAIMVFDRDGYLDYNQRTLELFGYESGPAFLESTPWDRSPPTQPDGRDSKEKALEHIEAAFETGEAFFEWTHQRQDGTTFPSEVKLTRFEYEGEPALHALIRDISDRKERERELAEREQKYRSLFADTRDALMLLDRDGFFDCNERTLDLFAVDSVEAFASFAPWELSPDTQPDGSDSRQAAKEQIETAFETGEAFFEWTHQRQDGTTFPAEVKLSRFQLHGEPALHALVRDITERKEYERELEELTTRLEFALEETDTGVWEWDVETDDLVWDEASERLIGYEPGTFPGTFEGFTEHIHDADVSAVRDAIHEALQTDRKLKTDFRVQTPDGDWKWIQARGVVDYEEGDPQRLIGIQTDVTDRKEREEAIRCERELNRRMQRVLADSRTRQVLEGRVTEQLHEHGYALAWIGEQVAGELVPRAVGGGGRYLETVDRVLDPDDGELEPSLQAALTGEAQYVGDIPAQESAWARTAGKYNYHSCAAIPIVYRDVSYGVLALYHEEPDRFADSEQELLGELTDTLAFAIHSLETQDALAADRTVAVTLQLTGGHYLAALAGDGALRGAKRVRVNGTVPVGEHEVLQYVEIEGGADPSVGDRIEAHPAVADATVTADGDPMQVQVTLTEPVPEAFLAARGVMVNETVIGSDSARIALEFRQDADITETVSALETAFGSGSVRAISERTRESSVRGRADTADLTDKQATALKAAYHNGYFDQPRRATATEIAESLGITHSTFLQHLHRAEEKIFGARFEEREG